jgi:hypothetical protein
VEAHAGEVLELRGDEALGVSGSYGRSMTSGDASQADGRFQRGRRWAARHDLILVVAAGMLAIVVVDGQGVRGMPTPELLLGWPPAAVVLVWLYRALRSPQERRLDAAGATVARAVGLGLQTAVGFGILVSGLVTPPAITSPGLAAWTLGCALMVHWWRTHAPKTSSSSARST